MELVLTTTDLSLATHCYAIDPKLIKRIRWLGKTNEFTLEGGFGQQHYAVFHLADPEKCLKVFREFEAWKDKLDDQYNLPRWRLLMGEGNTIVAPPISPQKISESWERIFYAVNEAIVAKHEVGLWNV